MMTVGFAVRSYVDKLIMVSFFIKSAYESSCKLFSVFKQLLISDGAGYRAVIEEEIDFAPGLQGEFISHCRIDAFLIGLDPIFFAFQANRAGLMRSEDDEFDA